MTFKIKFGTDGWRAKIADQFTFDNVELVTSAIAWFIKEKHPANQLLIVAYDSRFMAKHFAIRAAQVLNKCGIDVKITDRDTPTPVAAFSVKNLNTSGVIVFTASHNNYEYCGIKYIPYYAGPATPDITDIIMKNIENLQNNQDDFIAFSGSTAITEFFDPKPAYFAWVQNLIDFDIISKTPIKVFYDPMYSTGRGYLDELLRIAGCDVTVINDCIDPLYGGIIPDPKIEYLGKICELVKKNPGSIAMATDGDADRFGIIDEESNYIMPDTVIGFLVKHLYNNKGLKGAIVRTVATTHMLDLLAEKYSLKIYETPVGFKYIGEIMRREPVLIGGEESGGLSIINHIPEKDGILACLTVVEAMAFENKTLVELQKSLKNEINREYYYDRIDLRVDDFVKQHFVNLMANDPPREIAGIKLEKLSTVDGAKLYFNDGSWILTRPSGTENLLRIYFEALTIERLSQMIHYIKAVVEDIKLQYASS